MILEKGTELRLKTGNDPASKRVVVHRRFYAAADLGFNDPTGIVILKDEQLPEEKPVNILLQRVPRGDGVFIWKFSSATVAEIPLLYSEFGYGYIGEVLPTWFFDLRILGIHAWWWIAFLVLAVLTYFVMLAAVRLILILLHWSPITLSPVLERVFTGPGALLLYVLLFRSGVGPS